MKITKLLTALTCLILPVAMLAQEKVTVSGTITEVSGAPVMGAGVVQKGTQNGTVTDLDGHYSLTVPVGSMIEVSCIGFTTQEFPAFSATHDMVLEEDARLLDEVVVVGYGV